MNFKIEEFSTDLNIFEIYSCFKDNNSILLDSSKEDRDLSKYSFIGLNPFLTFEAYGRESYINGQRVCNGDPFLVLENLIKKYDFKYDIEVPLISGAIGYISYDAGRIIEDIKDISKEDFRIPDMRFKFYDNIIIFDLINNKKYLTALGVKEDSNKSIKKILDTIQKNINIYKSREDLISKNDMDKTKNNKFYSNFSKEEYIDKIKRLKEYIRSGDVYIANMTQRFLCESNEDSIKIYKSLRSINKAPFSAFVNYDDFQIISSSPERFIQIKDRKAHTRPIKGTRPRGKDSREDLLNKEALINSEKDKAELLMVVDLERNDFSKVCKPHTVKVTELFKLEEYATVFHLVSTIEGELKDEISEVKFIRECFPGGSITGTPKIRAMEIIEELEMLKRNIYTGCIGYFDFRGNSDFNIAIRTIIKKDNKAYFGVGGGITYDSIEEDEYEETLDKAKALMKVL
ncbi:aminodeoxychorismate synthase component I [Clostridium sp. NSJ-6]|uniref:Anthranilate synthase component 1 n=1 Tax=Clostridium hominis TaxID=2763036 RepID=A0ABR7DAZ1_9CLOT|nr:aminodeoxychorismate synthase component I [Clostridium hominis]MBC5628561.1 aminodeoxychorismate synthase component I [Clostridium hominis]MDU2672310.1 aminodeoxychorismate synthase component I [Clostridium sp.]